MLCLAINRLHKACNSSSSRQILTLTTGEICSRRSVTNRRWTSCTQLMGTSTLLSLSPTHTRLRLAARSDGEGRADYFLPCLRAKGESFAWLTSLIDRSSFSPPPSFQAALSGCTAVSCHVCLSIAFRFCYSLFFFLFHSVVSRLFPTCHPHIYLPCPTRN